MHTREMPVSGRPILRAAADLSSLWRARISALLENFILCVRRSRNTKRTQDKQRQLQWRAIEAPEAKPQKTRARLEFHSDAFRDLAELLVIVLGLGTLFDFRYSSSRIKIDWQFIIIMRVLVLLLLSLVLLVLPARRGKSLASGALPAGGPRRSPYCATGSRVV